MENTTNTTNTILTDKEITKLAGSGTSTYFTMYMRGNRYSILLEKGHSETLTRSFKPEYIKQRLVLIENGTNIRDAKADKDGNYDGSKAEDIHTGRITKTDMIRIKNIFDIANR